MIAGHRGAAGDLTRLPARGVGVIVVVAPAQQRVRYFAVGVVMPATGNPVTSVSEELPMLG